MKNVNNWGFLLIKGIILVILSFFIFGHPVSTLLGLAVYFGAALLVTGLLIVISAFSNQNNPNWGWRLTEGLIDLLFAFVLLSNPAITASVFPFVIGFWMIYYGVLLFTGSFTSKKDGDSNWWMALLGGILTVIFGYIMMTDLLAGSVAITFWIGSGVLLFGLINIFVALGLRKIKKAID